ncbi:hypothetical protein MRB53_032447 [Persea americana]|uniref:Uncharacterized protein n=1 Tax=Persea americana TaxID=3435 RepID=A0ACC2KS79_PERAE|nr:hypothetical protein MRB53_032447 [Persea americana]
MEKERLLYDRCCCLLLVWRRRWCQFLRIIWDKAGESVEVAVIRESTNARLNLTMVVDETTPDKFNSWPLPEKCRTFVNRIR